MILLMDGYGVQPDDWHVNEPVAAGFSRVYLVESGTLRYTQCGVTQLLEAGQLYLFPPVTPYSITAEPGEAFSCLWLHVDFFPAVFRQLLSLPADGPSVTSDFLCLLRRIFTEGRRNTPAAEGVLCAFGEYLCDEYLSHDTPEMAKAAAYIRTNFRSSDLNVNSISAYFGYTPEHFIRTFARTIGLTPYQYLLNTRMYEARRLLLENYTVKQAAQAVGYENPHVFSNAFRRRYGMSPGELRKICRPFA